MSGKVGLVVALAGTVFLLGAAWPVASTSSMSDQQLGALVAALEGEGFIVREGLLDFPPILKWCCECKLPSCYANNPSSPYGLFVLPPAPGQSVLNPYAEWFHEDETYPEGWSMGWRLRPDEAIVFIGKTPPEVDYFGFTAYLFSRYQSGYPVSDCEYADGGTREAPASAQDRFPSFSSLGDTINNLTVNTQGGPFNKPVIVIATADRRIESRIRDILQSAGYPESIMNTSTIPSRLANMGIEPDSDVFAMLVRIAADPSATLEAYMDNPGLLLRVTPEEVTPSGDLEPYSMSTLRVRGTGKTEFDLLPAVAAVRQAVVAAYPNYAATVLSTIDWPEGYQCVQKGMPCLGDNRDTPYTLTDPTKAEILEDDEFVMVVGVNHAATGKATYSNISLLGWGRKASPVVIDNREMPGSAQYYLDLAGNTAISNSTANKLYAWKIARVGHCGSEPFCREVSYECRGGLCEDETAVIVARAYLEHATMVGPAYNELVAGMMIKFVPGTSLSPQDYLPVVTRD